MYRSHVRDHSEEMEISVKIPPTPLFQLKLCEFYFLSNPTSKVYYEDGIKKILIFQSPQILKQMSPIHLAHQDISDNKMFTSN